MPSPVQLYALLFVLFSLGPLGAHSALADSALAGSASATVAPGSAAGFSLTPLRSDMSDEAVDLAVLRDRRIGRGLVGFAVGVQAFQFTFAILARALSDPIGPWAAGDSLMVEGIVSLVSIAAAPLGAVGFSKLAESRMRGTGRGLLQGGVYALSYAGLHLLFMAISEALPSGGQGAGFATVIVGVPLISSHIIVGAGMCIAAAVTFAKHRRSSTAARVSMPHRVALFPAPMVRHDGGGLALVAVF